MGSYAGQRRRTPSASGWIKFALLGVVVSIFFQGALCEIEPTESQCRQHIEKALKEQHEEDERLLEEGAHEDLINEQEGIAPTDELTDSIEGSIPKDLEGDEGKDDDDGDDDGEVEKDDDGDGEVEKDDDEDTKTEDDDVETDDGKTEDDDDDNAEEKVEDDGEKDEADETEAKEGDEDDDDAKEDTAEDQKADDDDDDNKDETKDDDDKEDDEKELEKEDGDDRDDDDDDAESILERPIQIDVHEVEMDDDDDDDKGTDGDEKDDQEGDDEKDEDDGKDDKEEDDGKDEKDEGDEKDEEDEKDDEEKVEKEEGDDDDEQESKVAQKDDDDDEEKEKEEDDDDDKKEDDDDDDDKKEKEDVDDDDDDKKEDVDDDDDKKEKEEVDDDDDKKEKEDVDDEDKADKVDDDDDDKTESDDKKDDEEDKEEVEEIIEKREAKESEAEGAAESEDAEDEKEDGDQESTPEEEELTQEMVIPDNLRPRDHISKILKLEDSDTETTLEKAIDTTLKSLKGLYDNAIKPLEMLYKYRDLSNRHFSDPEIFSKPLILFMGPWSGGKSSTINYLLDNEFSHTSLRTGAEPSPAYFNILMHGEEEEILDGTQLAADWTFSGLQKFGQGLLDRLKGIRLPNKLLEKVNIVEIPGILEIRKQVQRLFPFNDACQWFIDRADIIFLVYDPSKLDVGPETEAILDQLKGREYQTRIILNKADQVKPEELMRVQGTLIWNISPLMSSSEPPIMYSTSLWSMPYESGAPTRLLLAQERAFLRDLREAVDKRVENKIASARRFAVRVRNHAKMVDCYLTTYYNHKSFFGNRKKVSDDIIEYPQKYHIYEGLSTLTNISRYDLPDPDVYRDFFKINPLYDFKKLSETCTYFRGCPINKLDVAIAYELPELVGKYKKAVEAAKEQLQKENS